jgi:hypothetical protein
MHEKQQDDSAIKEAKTALSIVQSADWQLERPI